VRLSAAPAPVLVPNRQDFAGRATGVNGINAVDSATLSTNVAIGDIEPPDQGLCAGNGSVVET
jgi:hypothetical protein